MGKSSPTLRWATPADVKAIAEVHVRSWRSTYKGLIPDGFLSGLSVAKHVKMWTKNLQETSWRTLILEEEGQIIGFAGEGLARDEEFSDGSTGEIHGIYLLEDYWDRGLGWMLMTRALKELEMEGYKDVRIWVLKENERARAFYEKMGFVVDGATKVEERKGFDLHELRYARELEKDLGPNEGDGLKRLICEPSES